MDHVKRLQKWSADPGCRKPAGLVVETVSAISADAVTEPLGELWEGVTTELPVWD